MLIRLGAIYLALTVAILAPLPTARAQTDLPATPTPAPAFTLTIPGLPPVALRPSLPLPRRSVLLTPVISAGPVSGSAYYYVQPVDTIASIAAALGVDSAALMAANGMTRADTMEPGYLLRVPGPDGALPPWATAEVGADGLVRPVLRKSLLERMTPAARNDGPESPYYNTTWVTFFGRPGIDIMGAIGEGDPATVGERLLAVAAEYDAANGPQIGVRPAYHLVHGMATVATGDDGTHLEFLPDETVMAYIEEGQRLGIDVILDSQIAKRSPVDAIAPAFPYLQYSNVHLAIDPEFAVSHPGQNIPGNPIGYVTAAQVNEVQQAMADYMREHGIEGKRILMVHQFQSNMIVDKEQLDATFPEVELTLSVDGFGNPYVKTWKYNALVDAATPFTSFKLFYGWDDPLMTPAQALGVDASEHTDFIEITPNMIQYQ